MDYIFMSGLNVQLFLVQVPTYYKKAKLFVIAMVNLI